MATAVESLIVACSKIYAQIKRDRQKPNPSPALLKACSDIETLKANCYKHAMVIMEKFGELRPAFILMSKSGGVFPIIMENMPSGNDRLLMALCLKMLIIEARIDAYYTMFEAWGAGYDRHKAKPNEDGFVMPSKREDRYEVVMINCFLREGASSVQSYEIIRDEEGKFKGLQEEAGKGYEPENPLLANLYEV